MEFMENMPQPEQEQAQAPTILPCDTQITNCETEPVCPQAAGAEGYYHGMGVGAQEVIYEAPAAPSHHPWQDYYQSPANDIPVKSRKQKGAGRFWKGLVAAVVLVALVAGSCGVTVWLSNRAWQEQYDLLRDNLNEKIHVLQTQLENNNQMGRPGGELVDPGQNLTASQIYQQNVRSVVAITSTIRTTTSGGAYDATSSGTGFVLTANGYIATNHHVIEGATIITVTMYDGTSHRAALIGSDATNDVALLKIEATDLDNVVIGSSGSMQVGDQVVAIGNALGELTSSLTVGYVSGIDRDVSTDGSVITMIQTDAAINSGNSGGPLFNARGEVIGINTAKYSGTTNSGAIIEGIGFAIPIDDVIGMFDDLIRYGYIRSAYLGIYCTEVSEDATFYGVPKGVYVQETVEGYCAEGCGMQHGDIIIDLGGYEIRSMNDLSKALRAYSAGDTVTVTVWRSGQEVILRVTLDEKPH